MIGVLSVAFAGIITSCNTKLTFDDKIIANEDSFLFEFDSFEKKTANITTVRGDWEVVPSDSWILIDRQSDYIKVGVLNHLAVNQRTGTVTINAGSDSFVINITQTGAPITLRFDPEEINFAHTDAEPVTVTVITNAPAWDVQTEADWLATEIIDANSFRVSAIDNTIPINLHDIIKTTVKNVDPYYDNTVFEMPVNQYARPWRFEEYLGTYHIQISRMGIDQDNDNMLYVEETFEYTRTTEDISDQFENCFGISDLLNTGSSFSTSFFLRYLPETGQVQYANIGFGWYSTYIGFYIPESASVGSINGDDTLSILEYGTNRLLLPEIFVTDDVEYPVIYYAYSSMFGFMTPVYGNVVITKIDDVPAPVLSAPSDPKPQWMYSYDKHIIKYTK